MNGLLTALAVTGSLVVLTLLIALAGGWRPGGRSRPNEMTVREQVRRELALSDRDWREVRRAVDRGRAAPERLRPAAYDLARRTQEVRRQSFWVRRPRIATGIAVAYGVGFGVAQWFTGDDDPLWFRILRMTPGFVLSFGLLAGLDRARRRSDAAVEANT